MSLGLASQGIKENGSPTLFASSELFIEDAREVEKGQREDFHDGRSCF
jgi:hypothetical protein